MPKKPRTPTHQTRLTKPARRVRAAAKTKVVTRGGPRGTLRELRVQGLLSFGPNSPTMQFGSLNVLIGPNGSGKSNLIELLVLLRDMPEFNKHRRWASEWLWRSAMDRAELTAVIASRASAEPLRYRLALTEGDHLLEPHGERLQRGAELLYSSTGPHIRVWDATAGRIVPLPQRKYVSLRPSDAGPRSDLFRYRDERYPDVARLAVMLESWRFYRDWHIGPNSPVREPYKRGLPKTFLQEDGCNLALVLRSLQEDEGATRALDEALRDLHPRVARVEIVVDDDWGARFWLHEAGGLRIPASRLSDGTLHWLCLLAILLDPTPPPLICLEEPEVGLHPDLLHVLVRLLRDASQRTQLFVTTHSEVLVDALTDTPEAVMVCEHSLETGTTLRRLNHVELAVWLNTYSLGDLWRKGQLGGTRW